MSKLVKKLKIGLIQQKKPGKMSKLIHITIIRCNRSVVKNTIVNNEVSNNPNIISIMVRLQPLVFLHHQLSLACL